MYYAQFFQRAALPAGSAAIIEACGDRAVIILDGRMSSENMGRIAAEECARRGFVAWCVCKGETFTRSQRLHAPNYVRSDTPDRTAHSASHGA